MRGLVVLLLLTPLLAGCADDAPAKAPDAALRNDSEADGLDAVLHGTAPAPWQVGFWWRYDSPDGITTRVVTGDGGDHWIMEAEDIATAFHDTRYDISTMGPRYKEDLAGSQGAQRIQFYDWPLEDGKEWTTIWDGAMQRVVATKGEGLLWQFEAYDGEIHRVSYTYDPFIGAMTEMIFRDDEGGEAFSLALRDHGEAYDGQIHRVELVEWATLNLTTGVHGETLGAVPESTDLWLDINFNCPASGQFFIALGPAGNADAIVFPDAAAQGYAADEVCPYGGGDQGVIAESPYGENWGYSADFVSPEGSIQVDLIARIITPINIIGGQIQPA